MKKLYHSELQHCPTCEEYVHVDSCGRVIGTDRITQHLRITTDRLHVCPPPWKRRKK
jgi:hypothetical protein